MKGGIPHSRGAARCAARPDMVIISSNCSISVPIKLKKKNSAIKAGENKIEEVN